MATLLYNGMPIKDVAVAAPREGYIPGRDMLSPRHNNKLSDAAIDDLHWVVLNTAHQETSTMRESVFRDVFMPVFAGKEPNPELVASYVHGAGGFNRRVTIVDDNTGQVLFTVPPVLGTQHIKGVPDDRDAPTMMMIASMAELIRRISSTQADNHLATQMSKRLLQAKNGRAAVQYDGEWIALMARYGYGPGTQNENTTNAAATGSAAAATNANGGLSASDVEDVF